MIATRCFALVFCLAHVRFASRGWQRATSLAHLYPFHLYPRRPSRNEQTALDDEPLSLIMFKSILSSKRIPSSDFDMLTTLGESAVNGKENHPALAVTTNVPTTKTRNDKTHKKSKTKEQPGLEPGDMEMAFDRLLVRIPSVLNMNDG